jgi:hypothetical protein
MANVPNPFEIEHSSQLSAISSNESLRVYEKPAMTLLYRKLLVTVDDITNIDGCGKSGMGMCKHTWL